MKERPILFSAPMVRALLAGTKTQTRRIAKPVRHPDLGNVYTPGALVLEHEPQHVIERCCPYGQPGDRLWVRETFGHFERNENFKPGCDVFFRADGNCLELEPWRPSIHMPRWASRILLEITDVRVERLQDISREDAQAEGCDHNDPCDHVRHSCASIGCQGPDYRVGYRQLWEQINGAGSWAANPWVWAITFRRVEGQQP